MVSGRGCSSRSTTTSGVPRRPGTVTGTSSSAKLAGVVGGAGALLGAHRELVLLLAGDAVVAAQVLGRLQHAAGDRVVLAAGGLAGADEAVHQLDAAAADAGAQAERVVLDVATSTRRRRPRRRWRRRWRPGPRRTGRPAGRSRSGGRAGGRGRRCRGRRRGRRSGRWPGSRRWGSSCPGRRRRRRPRRSPVRRTSSASVVDARSTAVREASAPPKRPTGVRTGSQITMSGMPRR